MTKSDQDQHSARYTLEFRLEAVRLVRAGQEASVTARVLGTPKRTLSNWIRLAEKGELQGAGGRPVSAELARVKMEWLTTITLAGRRQLSWPVEGLRRE